MTKFAVPEMSCPKRRASIEQALTRLDPQVEIHTDLKKRMLNVETKASSAMVLSVLSQVGFAANVARQTKA